MNYTQTRPAEKNWKFGNQTQRPSPEPKSFQNDNIGPTTYDWDKAKKKGHMAPFSKSQRINLQNQNAANI